MKDPGDNNGDNSKTKQTSNHDKAVDDGSEESIVVSESNLSNDEVTTTGNISTADHQASKGDLTSTLRNYSRIRNSHSDRNFKQRTAHIPETDPEFQKSTQRLKI